MEKTRVVLLTAISLTLFVGGISILILQAPFWSLFLGIPSIQIGIILIIFTFDRLSQDEVEKQLKPIQEGEKEIDKGG